MQLLEGPELPWRLAIVSAVGSAALSVSLGIPSSAPAIAAPGLGLDLPAASASRVAEVASVEAPPAPRPLEIGMVFHLDGEAYVKLADLPRSDEWPSHGRFRVIHDSYVDAAIAPVIAAVPAPKRVVIGGRCGADVTGQTIVARVTGYPGYAHAGGDAWTLPDILNDGNVIVAAKLESSCDGAYARDESLPAIGIPAVLQDADLEAAAKAAVLASPAAQATQREWSSFDRSGRWSDEATWTTQVLYDAPSGRTWVAVHAHQDHACGDPEVNVWGVFQVRDDRTLHALQVRISDLEDIEHLIIVDGQLEVVGKPWLGIEHAIETIDGQVVDQLVLPFYGCPC